MLGGKINQLDTENKFNLLNNEWIINYCNKLNKSDALIFKNTIDLINYYYPSDAKNKFDIPLKEYLIDVAKIIEQLDLSNDAILATFCSYLPVYLPNKWKDKLNNIASEKIVKLVEGVDEVQKLTDFVNNSSIMDSQEQEKQAEAMRKMLIAMVNDIRVVIIKLSLRATTLKFFNNNKTRNSLKLKIAKETLDIFAPLANRLGIWQLKWQLEDLGFRYYNIKEYRKITKLLDEKREERLKYIEEFNKNLKSEIEKTGIKCEVIGRPKHIYSIYKKMQKKKLSFANLYDIRAVRVLVNSVNECYSVLGIVHSLYKPISGEFDDYISHPKNNDYRSLHTVVIGPQYKGIEIQIRTFEMHEFAEYGVAAHWKYKEDTNLTNSSYDKKISWLRQLLELKENTNQFENKDLAIAFRTELFKDTIYTLTPNGKVIPLPYGSTSIDFAYALHTDIGNRCKGAKVNGKITSLSKPLKNGQRVEIITSKIDNPSINWIHEGWVKSPKAISKIKSFIRKQNKEAIINNGKNIFDKELEKINYKLNTQKILEKFKIDKIEDLFLHLAYGDISLKSLNNVFKDLASTNTYDTKEKLDIEQKLLKKNKVYKNNNILIKGETGLFTNLAKCCKPTPCDEIIGYVTKDKGISIHRKNCLSFKRLIQNNSNKVIEASWGNINDDTSIFSVDILIKAKDRQGLIRDISDVFLKNKINLTNIVSSTKNSIATLKLTIDIKNKHNITQIINNLEQLKDIINIVRL